MFLDVINQKQWQQQNKTNNQKCVIPKNMVGIL